MRLYLVEVYVPRSRADGARAAGRRAGAAVAELSREQVSIRYLRTTYLPDDETCFHVFEADSADDVAEAARRAGIGSGRIVSAIDASLPAGSADA